MYNNKNTNYQYGSLYLKMGGLMLKHPSSIKKKVLAGTIINMILTGTNKRMTVMNGRMITIS